MMYWVRFAIVCASVFILLYATASILLAIIWNRIQRLNLIQSADVLFILRILPLLAASTVLLLVVAPSFWVLEPPAADEWIGFWAALLSLGYIGWLVVRGASLYRAWSSTNKIFARATPLRESDVPFPVYELQEPGANLFIAGIVKPRLLVSREAIELLDPEELRAAIRHELAHANSGDNLKQLMVRFCGFPFVSSLDLAWLRAAEIAADDRSVTDALTAADLASALIKVGTAAAGLTPELAMSLVPEADTPVSDRVRRLLAWKSAKPRRFLNLAATVLSLQAAVIASTLPWLIPQMHRFTELLFQ